MNPYVIMTDTTADLPESYIKEHELAILSLSYTIDGTTYDRENPLDVREFYAKMRGGSMPTTAQVNPEQAKEAFKACLEQGKDVFAFPGPVGQEGSEGPLQILREGAILFRDAADVLSDMGWEHREPASQTLNAMPELDGDRQTVLSLLTVEELSFDQLTFRTGMEPSRLNTALTLLELQGLIAQSSGRIYHKA